MRKKVWTFSTNCKSEPTDHLKDILTAIFEPESDSRPTIEQLIKHKWISEEYQKVEQNYYILSQLMINNSKLTVNSFITKIK